MNNTGWNHVGPEHPPTQKALSDSEAFRAAPCSPLARRMMDAARNRKGDLFGDAAKRVIHVADGGMNLYEIAQWNNVVDVLRELSQITENSPVHPPRVGCDESSDHDSHDEQTYDERP